MVRRIKQLLIFAAALITPAALSAQYFEPADFVEDRIYYTILEDGESVGVHVREPWAGLFGMKNYTIETVEIPSHVFSTAYNREFVVKQINSKAFTNSRTYVKNITIPETIESIGDYAFFNTGLQSGGVDSHGIYYFLSAPDNMFFFNAKRCESIGKKITYRNQTGTESDYTDDISKPIEYCYFRVGNEVELLPSGLPYIKMDGKTLFIPDNVRTIEGDDDIHIIWRCHTLVFGNNLEFFGRRAFNASVVYATSATPPECVPNSRWWATTLYVPVGTLEAYKAAPLWGQFPTIIEKDYIAVESLDLGYDEVSIYQGETLRFNPRPFPLNSTAFEKDGNGVTMMVARNRAFPDHQIHLTDATFEGVEVGEYDVTAYVDSVIAKCHVTVLPEYQGNVQCVRIQMNGMDFESSIIKSGDLLNLEALIYPANSQDIEEYQEVSWTSSDDAVASVSGNGVVSAISEGECDIMVTIKNTTTGNEFSDVCHIVVDDTNAISNVSYDSLDAMVDVYNMQGQQLRNRVPRESATHGLPSGIYIVDHKKVIVK